MSSEFRHLHCAREVLALYIDSNRDISVIEKLMPVDRGDALLAVFEKEPEAYRVIERKGFYYTLARVSFTNGGMARISMQIVTITLNSLVEYPRLFTLNEALNMFVEVLGADKLPDLLEATKENLERRIEIMKPYFVKDDAWTEQARTVNHAVAFKIESLRAQVVRETPEDFIDKVIKLVERDREKYPHIVELLWGDHFIDYYIQVTDEEAKDLKDNKYEYIYKFGKFPHLDYHAPLAGRAVKGSDISDEEDGQAERYEPYA